MKRYIALFIALMVSCALGETLLLQESFEGGSGNYSANSFDDGANDYFKVDDGTHSGLSVTFSGYDGSKLWIAEDADAPDNPLGTGASGYIVFKGVDVSAYDTVLVKFTLGASNYTNGGPFESNKYLKVQYAYDGDTATSGGGVNSGTYTTFAAFYGRNGVVDTDTLLSEDTDLNGTADGPYITPAMQEYSYKFLVGGGTKTSIRVEVFTAAYEDLAIDNIRIYGIAGASNTNPTITINDGTPLAYTEDNSATLIDAAATTSDADGNADWNGGSLKVQITANSEAADEISISDTDGDGTAITVSGTNIFANGTDIGDLSASGGVVTNNTMLTITFDSDATNANVQEVLQSIRYRNTSDNPGTSNRTVTFTVTDKNAGTANDARTISVTAADNDTPTMSINKSLSLNEGATKTIPSDSLSATDVDDNDATLTYTITTGPSNGQVENSDNPGVAITTFTQQNLNDGKIRYVHGDGNNTSDSFIFKVSDDGANELTGQTYNITVVAVDDDTPTISTNNGLSLNEGATKTIPLDSLEANDTDTDNSTLTFTITSAPSNGQVENSDNPGVAITTFTQQNLTDGKIRYVHGDGNNTSDSFVFKVADGTPNELTGQTFSITVVAVDDDTPTISTNNGLSLNEGATKTIPLDSLEANDTDTDNSTLTYTITSAPSNGQVENSDNPGVSITTFTQQNLIDGKIRYVHNGSNTTSDAFTFKVADGTPNELTGQTFSITVVAVDDDTPTISTNNGLSLNEGATKTIPLDSLEANDTDTDNSTLTYTITSAPSNGQVENSDNPGVSITTFTQQNLTDGKIRYVHGDGNNTTDSFVFKVADGTPNELTGQTFSITVVAVDDDTPTISTNNGLSLNEGATKAIPLDSLEANDTDTDNSTLTFTITSAPSNGQVENSDNAGVAITTFSQQNLIDGKIRYVHGDGNNTSDSFVFKVADGTPNELTGQTFTITVNAVDDDAPTISTNKGLSLNEGATKTIPLDSLEANDADTDNSTLTYTITSAPSNGQVENSDNPGVSITTFTQQNLTDGKIRYVHDGSNTTSDAFTFKVADGVPNELTNQTFNITVASQNDAPTIVATIADTTVTEDFTAINYRDLNAVFTDEESGSALTFSVVSLQGKLTPSINGADSVLVLTAVSNATGIDTVVVTASDGSLEVKDSVVITINADNDAPTVVTPISDTVVTEDFTPLNYRDLNAVFTDVESGNALSFTAISLQSKITPSINSVDSVLILTAVNNATGVDTIVVTASDGSLEVKDTVIITINNDNDAPTVVAAMSDTTVTEDFAPINYRDLNAVFTDVESGSALSFSAASLQGRITSSINGSDSVLVLTAVSNATGIDTVIVTASDGSLSVADTVIITVNADNDAPTVVTPIADTTVLEDFATAIAYRDLNTVFTDVESGSNLVFSVNALQSKVTASVRAADSVLLLTSKANINGIDTLVITASDGLLSVSDSMIVTISAVNDAPTLTNATTQTVPEDSLLTITVAMTDGADVDGDDLSIVLSSGSNYTIAGDTVKPTENFTGALSVPVAISDGTVTTATVTMTINVTAKNDAPVIVSAIPDTIISEDFTPAISFRDLNSVFIDEESGSALSFTVNSLQGKVTPAINSADSVLTLTAVANAHGIDTLVVSASDGALSVSDTVVITVSEVNDAPTLTSATTQTVAEDTPLALTLAMTDGADVDGDDLTLIVDAGTNYTVSGTTITPAANFNGALTVPIKVTDGVLTTAPVNMTVTVTAVNDAPTLTSATTQTVAEDTPLALTLAMTDGTDVDGDALTLIVEAGTNYTVSGTTITPAANFNGTLTVPVKVTDGVLTTAPVNMTVTVTAVNDAPTLTSATAQTVAEDTPLALTVAMTDGADVDGDNLTLIVDAGSNYTVSGTTITPTVNFNGTLTVPVKVTDGSFTTAPVNMTVTVTAVNDVPTLTSATTQTVAEDTPLALTLAMTDGADVDGDDLTLIVDAGSNYTVSGTTITPAANFNGALTVPIKVTDGVLTTAPVNMTVTVTAVNDAPTLTSATAQTVAEDTPLALTLAMTDGADVDGDALTLLVDAGSNYTVNGTTITPAANFNGTLTVPVKVTDGSLTTAPVNMTVTVTAVNDAPTLTSATTQTIIEDSTFVLTMDMVEGEADVDGDALTITALAGANYTVNGASVKPAVGFVGVLDVSVVVTDGIAQSNVVVMKVTVLSGNNAPVLLSVTPFIMIQDKAKTLTIAQVKAADVDGDNLSLIINGGENFSVSGTTIIPGAEYSGNILVPICVTDGKDTSNVITSTVVVKAAGTNSAPVLEGVQLSKIEKNTSVILTLDSVTATDADADALTILIGSGENYSVQNTTITPDSGFVGKIIVPVSVTDGLDTSVILSKTVSVYERILDFTKGQITFVDSTVASVIPNPVSASDGRVLLRSHGGVYDRITVKIYDHVGNLLGDKEMSEVGKCFELEWIFSSIHSQFSGSYAALFIYYKDGEIVKRQMKIIGVRK